MKITEIQNTPWRDALLPASFRGEMFHVESGGRENGRRIVLHEFPKRDIPYPEDMGKRAIAWTVRGYCIVYPFVTTIPLYQRDYRIPRDRLITALEKEGPATLQLPTIDPMTVVCQSYRWSEEERLGGYCVFDMQFVEYGDPLPLLDQPSSTPQLVAQSQAMKVQVLAMLAGVDEMLRVRALPQQTKPAVAVEEPQP